MLSKKINRKVKLALNYLILIIFAGFFLFPIYWLLLQSLKVPLDTIAYPPKFFFSPTLRNYQLVLSRPGLLMSFFSSFIIAAGSVLVALLFGAPAAYSFARYNFKGKEHFAFFILSTKLMPYIVVVIPFVQIFGRLHLTDTYFSLIISHVLIHLALVVWMLRAFIQNVPISVEEAARIDGCTRMGALVRVVFPLIVPGLVATGLLSFIFSWNELLFALALTTQKIRTLPVRFATEFIGYTAIDWGAISASGILGIILPIVIVLSIEKYLVSGFTFGVLEEK